MDWITGIQKAIDYIEEHITEELHYDEISKQAYSSSYHFQRVFGCCVVIHWVNIFVEDA